MVVHGRDGEDEISVTSPTRVVMIDENNAMEDFEFDPRSLGIPEFSIGDLAGGSPEENARTAEALLSGGGPPALREAVAVNSGAALYLYGLCGSISEGYLLASEALVSGKVQTKLEEIRRSAGEISRAEAVTTAAQPAQSVSAPEADTHPVGTA
jgi:anthranilate synthase/phosphoribosyltransferase